MAIYLKYFKKKGLNIKCLKPFSAFLRINAWPFAYVQNGSGITLSYDELNKVCTFFNLRFLKLHLVILKRERNFFQFRGLAAFPIWKLKFQIYNKNSFLLYSKFYILNSKY